jgi:hypothetical protein
MKEGAAEFWAAAMFSGPGSSSSQVEKLEYSEDYLGALFKGGRVEGAAE